MTTGLPRQFRCFVFWSLFSPPPLDTNNIHTTSSGNFFNGTVAPEAPTPIGMALAGALCVGAVLGVQPSECPSECPASQPTRR